MVGSRGLPRPAGRPPAGRDPQAPRPLEQPRASRARGLLQLTVLASLAPAAEALAAYRLTTSSLVGSDVGSYAAPFCADMDGDGDVDCLVGHSDGRVQLFENRGSTGQHSFARTSADYFGRDVGSYAAPFCADLDGDGRLDCLVGSSNGYVSHFRREASGWSRPTSNFFGADLGSYPVPFCADMDGDGRIDCLVGESGGQVLFMRRTSGSLSFRRESQKFFGQRDFGSRAAPTCADLDGDGTLECLVGNSVGSISYLRQSRSSGTWILESDNAFNYDFGSYAVPFCIDVDGDGVLDCLVGESTGYVRLMQRPLVVFSYEGTLLSDVGSYSVPRCVDVDGDGDLDCLVGDSGGNVELFRNDGASPEVQFTRSTSNLLGSSPGSYAAPSCFDADGDGDVDCLVGTSDGEVTFFSNSSSWRRVGSNYLPLHVSSYAVPFCIDADHDGDVDCLVGGSDGKVWYFDKDGSSYARASANFFGHDVGSYAAPACVDLDGDGRLDCLVGESGGTVRHFRNDATGAGFRWVLASSNFFSRDFGSRAAPFCADIDGDGAMDCLVGHSAGTVHYMRARDARAPLFTKERARHFSSVGAYARPHCVDLDEDGLIDCVIGGSSGYVHYYRNSGSAASPSWSRQSTNFLRADVGSYASPFCFDTDGDGDKDCLVGTSTGRVQHFRNDRWFMTRAETDYFSRDVGSNAAPFCVDMDADGDMDCLVGSSDGRVHYFRRDGDSWSHRSSDLFSYDVGSYAAPFCADLDADGDVDCLVGESGGEVFQFRNDGTPASYRWVLATRSHLNMDIGSRPAPFCLDIDGDGDLDCLVGGSDGYVDTFKNQADLNAVASAAPPSTTSTTMPIAPAPGPSRACADGSYLSSGASCERCAAGRYDTRASSDASTCIACPHCTDSIAGSTSCKQLASCWLETVNGTSVALRVDHDGRGRLRLRLTMPPLPAPARLHHGVRLAYGADLQNSTSSLAWSSACGSLWSMGADAMEVSLPYEQLGGACSLGAELRAADVLRSGFAAVLVRSLGDGRLVRLVSLPLEIRLPREVGAVVGPTTTTTAPAPTTAAAPSPTGFLQPVPPAVESGGSDADVIAGVLTSLVMLLCVGPLACFCFYKKRRAGAASAGYVSPGGFGKVHPSSSVGESIPVSDPRLVQAMQAFFDATFRDRHYSGTFKPQHLQVMEVHSVQNPGAEADYQSYKAALRRKRSGGCGQLADAVLSTCASPLLAGSMDASINECLVFHGTSAAAARAIVQTDFALPKAHAHGAIYGGGVYLAESNTKAHMYCQADPRGWVPILIVQVALGIIHNTVEDRPDGAALMRGAQAGTYDSVCGDRRKLKWNFSGWREFVVYDKAQAVARYVVWCKPK